MRMAADDPFTLVFRPSRKAWRISGDSKYLTAHQQLLRQPLDTQVAKNSILRYLRRWEAPDPCRLLLVRFEFVLILASSSLTLTTLSRLQGGIP